jgi:hypothetical protein
MCSIAKITRSVTIVGDPDQSSAFLTLIPLPYRPQWVFYTVYGWRAAEVENLAKMRRGMSLYHIGKYVISLTRTSQIFPTLLKSSSKRIIVQPALSSKRALQLYPKAATLASFPAQCKADLVT